MAKTIIHYLLAFFVMLITWGAIAFSIDLVKFKMYESKEMSDSMFYSSIKNPYFYYMSRKKYPVRSDTIRVDTTKKILFIKQTSYINDSLDFWRITTSKIAIPQKWDLQSATATIINPKPFVDKYYFKVQIYASTNGEFLELPDDLTKEIPVDIEIRQINNRRIIRYLVEHNFEDSLKATQFIELLKANYPEIESPFLVRYKNAQRLTE